MIKQALAQIMRDAERWEGDCVALCITYLAACGREIERPDETELTAEAVTRALGKPRRKHKVAYGDITLTSTGMLGIWLGYALLTVAHGESKLVRHALVDDDKVLGWRPF